MAKRILKAWSPKGSCDLCGKWSYGSRQGAAKAAKALHPGIGMTAVRCELGAPVWHFTLAIPRHPHTRRAS